MPVRRRQSKKIKRSKKRRSTMGKNQAVVKPSVFTDTDNETETETLIYAISNKEKDVDLELLKELSSIPRTGPSSAGVILNKQMIKCSLDRDETAECVTYIRQVKEMLSILNLTENMIIKKLQERDQFRIKRLLKLKSLDLVEGYFHYDSELTNKIKNIIDDTGGLVVDLHIESLGNYQNLLGERILDLYQDYKKSANIKGRETIREVVEAHIKNVKN